MYSHARIDARGADARTGPAYLATERRGHASLGLCCTEEGLFLGRTPLVERGRVRPHTDLVRLFRRAYGADTVIDRVLPGLGVVAVALAENNLALAQIAAVQLCLPDLSDLSSRSGMEAEDRVIKAERGDLLARAGWDPDLHPRAGAAPNRGWFAPTNGGDQDRPVQIAGGDENERTLEEMLDPLGPVRQARWDAAIRILREIDPANPNLTYFANPGSAPSQAALNRLEAKVEAATVKRIVAKVMPGGRPIGVPGHGLEVRELPGGLSAAERLFDYLRVGGTVSRSEDNLTVVKLPGNVGHITYRPHSRSGGPAVDINLPGLPFDKIHFK